MIIIGKKALAVLENRLYQIINLLDEQNTLLAERKENIGLTSVLESNQKFMDTLTHFLAMEEKTRMRESALKEARTKDLEETPGDIKY